ncbi:ER membrane protein complex subunit 1 [Porphyridium purpureum]|uniref:ER membrane protein complex subunit 1 n=1 Tax=Porphyridium purpureum TaxID=35688 RepID=A0A5J4YZ97_PORPP|nr:ER membrane protein complex subunit 1 [Porphyridium purpureum]|eukprot:POR7475..scf209_3
MLPNLAALAALLALLALCARGKLVWASSERVSWKRESVGKPIDALVPFSSSSSLSAGVIVLSDLGIAAGIDGKRGDLLWRSVPPMPDLVGRRIAFSTPGALGYVALHVPSSSMMLRVVDTTSAMLLWEIVVCDHDAHAGLMHARVLDRGPHNAEARSESAYVMLLSCDGTLTLREVLTGHVAAELPEDRRSSAIRARQSPVIMRSTIPSADYARQAVDARNHVFVVQSVLSDGTALMDELSLPDWNHVNFGTEYLEIDAGDHWTGSEMACRAASEPTVWLAPALTPSLCFCWDTTGSLVIVSSAGEVYRSDMILHGAWTTLRNESSLAFIRGSDRAVRYIVHASSQRPGVREWQPGLDEKAVVCHSEGDQPVAITISPDSPGVLRLHVTTEPGFFAVYNAEQEILATDKIETCFVALDEARNYSHVLLGTALGYSMFFEVVQSGTGLANMRMVWRRIEALAYTTDVRLFRSVVLERGSMIAGVAYNALGGRFESNEEEMVLVVLTGLGTVLGLSSRRQGAVVWDVSLPLAERERLHGSQLFALNASHAVILSSSNAASDLTSQEEDEFADFDIEDEDDVSAFQAPLHGSWRGLGTLNHVALLNALTGEIETGGELQQIHLGESGLVAASFLASGTLVTLSATHELGILPTKAWFTAPELPRASEQIQFLHTAEHERMLCGVSVGFHDERRPTAQASPPLRKMMREWLMRLPEGERVIKIASVASSATWSRGPILSSAAKVGNGSRVLFKYQNPMVTLVLAERPGGEHGQASGISAYVVDAEIGSVLDFVFHEGATGPVDAIRRENWMVYSFWNAQKQVQELVVCDIYEDRQGSPWLQSRLVEITRRLVSGRGIDHIVRVSHTGEFGKPRVLRQSFVVAERITALGVTQTEKSVTSRSVLIALASGRVLQAPKSILDPRRGSSQPEFSAKAEFLVPYHPLIGSHAGFFPGGLATGKDQVTWLGLHGAGIRTTYVHQEESSSHVVFSGLDLMYTVLSPAGRYDRLSHDFGFAMLICTVLGLAVVTVIIGRYATKRRMQWRFL